MRIIIKETGEEKCLSLIDRKNGQDYIQDIIGNSDELGIVGNQKDLKRSFLWDESRDAFICDKEDFLWWRDVTEDLQHLENVAKELAKRYGDTAVDTVLADVDTTYIEDYAVNAFAALRDAFPDDFPEGWKK